MTPEACSAPIRTTPLALRPLSADRSIGLSRPATFFASGATGGKYLSTLMRSTSSSKPSASGRELADVELAAHRAFVELRRELAAGRLLGQVGVRLAVERQAHALHRHLRAGDGEFSAQLRQVERHRLQVGLERRCQAPLDRIGAGLGVDVERETGHLEHQGLQVGAQRRVDAALGREVADLGHRRPAPACRPAWPWPSPEGPTDRAWHRPRAAARRGGRRC